MFNFLNRGTGLHHTGKVW